MGSLQRDAAASLGNPMTMLPLRQQEGGRYAVYTNMVPGGGFRG